MFNERYGVVPADARAGCEQAAQPSDHRHTLFIIRQNPSRPSPFDTARFFA
jgi:hypothetical protein